MATIDDIASLIKEADTPEEAARAVLLHLAIGGITKPDFVRALNGWNARVIGNHDGRRSATLAVRIRKGESGWGKPGEFGARVEPEGVGDDRVFHVIAWLRNPVEEGA